MEQIQINNGWKMRICGTEQWFLATVPGCVYNDLLNNKQIKDPFWRDQEHSALTLMEQDYEYYTTFVVPEKLIHCKKLLLHFDGIDTVGDIYCNGHFLGHVENMHRIWEYDITSIIKKDKNELRIILFSPTKFIREAYKHYESDGAPECMQGFPHLRKAHYMFGWDWGARLPDAGIWRSVTLLGVDIDAIDSVHIRQAHQLSKVTLEIDVITKQHNSNTHYEVVLYSPDKKQIKYKNSPKEIKIENPILWWPNGYGNQSLYEIEIILKEENLILDTWKKKIGLRTVTISREKDSYGESFTPIINGIKIFSMGANYIPEDHILARVTEEKTRKLLTDAKLCHFNTIRVWGGGYYPNDFFYNLCDELGLLVWQDFMFACALYKLTEEFEQNIIAEFIDNIKRIRHHACLALWCGNNEMEMFLEKENEWLKYPKQKSDYINLYEYILPKTLKKYDPDTFYWPASPSSGGAFDKPNDENRGDAHYWEVWHESAPFTAYRKYYFRYISEFGFQSFPTLKTIESFTLPEDRNIFSYIMEKHQRNNAANGKIMNYLSQTYLYPTQFAIILYASQMLQAEAIRYGVEHFRRHRGRCMGTVYWQLNDCWPVASWSSIDYYGRWKALQYYCKRFFAPVLLSCQEEGMLNHFPNINAEKKEIPKQATFCITNDTLEEKKLLVYWSLRNNQSEIKKEGTISICVSPLSTKWLDSLSFPDADILEDYLAYELWEEETMLSFQTEIFSIPKYFHFKEPNLKAQVNHDTIQITAQAYAKGVEIQNETEDLILSDNYFDMNAGEKQVKIISGNPAKITLRSIFNIR